MNPERSMIPTRSLLIIQQAAQVTGISVPTLYKWAGLKEDSSYQTGQPGQILPHQAGGVDQTTNRDVDVGAEGLRLSNSRLLVGLPHARSQRPEYSREGDSLPGQLGR